MAAAVQPNSLGTLRKHVTKTSEQVAAPPSTTHAKIPESGERRTLDAVVGRRRRRRMRHFTAARDIFIGCNYYLGPRFGVATGQGKLVGWNVRTTEYLRVQFAVNRQTKL